MDLPLGGGRTLDIGNWSYGLLGAFVKAGATAVTSGVIISAKDPKDYAFLGWAFFVMIFQLFVGSGIILGVFPYLKEHALPDWKTTVTERSAHTTDMKKSPEGEVEATRSKHTTKTTVTEPAKLDDTGAGDAGG